MDRKQEILRRLSGAEDFVSGQELCSELRVSRTAVWKIIGKLKEEGYPIEAVTNKGYRLLSIEEADVFNHDTICRKLRTEWAGRPLVFREETGSTNDDIFALAAEGYPHGTLAAASRQISGKGRRGRNWISPQDGNIYMSILLKPDIRPESAPMLTVVMALSVYQALQDLLPPRPTSQPDPAPQPDTRPHPFPQQADQPDPAPQPDARPHHFLQQVDQPCSSPQPDARAHSDSQTPARQDPHFSADPQKEQAGPRFGIKWPNDIVASVDGGPYRKLCGILTEMRMEDNDISAITIGAGLNVNQTVFEPEIAENATSVSLTLGKQINRAALTAAVWKYFEQNYRVFTSTCDFSGLRKLYEEGLVNRGKAVHVLDPVDPYTGTATGINDRGELLVKPDNGGPTRAVGTGEVSVRGVAGYV